jgi:hypothetical protein
MEIIRVNNRADEKLISTVQGWNSLPFDGYLIDFQGRLCVDFVCSAVRERHLHSKRNSLSTSDTQSLFALDYRSTC